jgi:hypothetical protein
MILHHFYECLQVPASAKSMEMGLYHCQMHPSLKTTIQAMEASFKGATHLYIKLPKRVCKFHAMWAQQKGITLWCIWIEHNDFVFHKERWQQKKL